MDSKPGPLDDDAIERIGTARDFATKEANRFFLIALVFTLLYGAKTIGLHIDEVVINKDVGTIKNGAFIYLVVSQFSMTLAQLRSSDSHAFESTLIDALKANGNPTAIEISERFPNAREWFSPTTTKMRKQINGGISKAIYNVTSAVTVLIALVVYFLPVIAGLYFVGDVRNVVFSSEPDIELTVVVASTALCALWIANSIAIYILLSRSTVSEASANGDNVPGR